jgi:hypothetical protein
MRRTQQRRHLFRPTCPGDNTKFRSKAKKKINLPSTELLFPSFLTPA